MGISALLRLVVVTVLTMTTLLAAIPAHARTDDYAGPRWLDQTVYRPDCLPADCSCDCRSEHLCLPGCVRW